MPGNKVIKIFVKADDFRIEFYKEIKSKMIENKQTGKRNLHSRLTDSEIINISILFHYGQFINFKSY
jgi:hypothetical protein